MRDDEESKKIFAKIIILYDNVDALNAKYPKPRNTCIDDIVEAFERRILVETKKLKDLEKDK